MSKKRTIGAKNLNASENLYTHVHIAFIIKNGPTIEQHLQPHPYRTQLAIMHKLPIRPMCATTRRTQEVSAMSGKCTGQQEHRTGNKRKCRNGN
jgi:hypothetical protein